MPLIGSGASPIRQFVERCQPAILLRSPSSELESPLASAFRKVSIIRIAPDVSHWDGPRLLQDALGMVLMGKRHNLPSPRLERDNHAHNAVPFAANRDESVIQGFAHGLVRRRTARNEMREAVFHPPIIMGRSEYPTTTPYST